MKTDAEFQRCYETTLRPILEELEGRRHGAVRMLRKVWFVAAGGFLLSCVLGALRSSFIPPVAGAVLAVLAVVVAWSMLFEGLAADAKRKALSAVARFLDPSLSYDPEGHVAEEQFRASRIFSRAPDRFRGEDHVRGRAGSTEIEFSEVHAEYKTAHVDNKGRTHTQWHTIFKGLFVVADFNKEFRGTTVVLPDSAERSLGWVGQKLQELAAFLGPGELVKLEDPEFEREFVVYGDSQLEARYILTPSLMQRLLDFKRKTGRPVWFSFVRSSVYIAVETGRDMFEPDLARSLLEPGVAQDYLRDLQLAVGIVDDLDLNTRIWTKE